MLSNSMHLLSNGKSLLSKRKQKEGGYFVGAHQIDRGFRIDMASAPRRTQLGISTLQWGCKKARASAFNTSSNAFARTIKASSFCSVELSCPSALRSAKCS
jgi:hypothetical protein